MVEVRDQNGEIVHVPERLNGMQLREMLNIPENKCVYKVTPQGQENVIEDWKEIRFVRGERIEVISVFRAG